jgi:hypothetical protein
MSTQPPPKLLDAVLRTIEKSSPGAGGTTSATKSAIRTARCRFAKKHHHETTYITFDNAKQSMRQ